MTAPVQEMDYQDRLDYLNSLPEPTPEELREIELSEDDLYPETPAEDDLDLIARYAPGEDYEFTRNDDREIDNEDNYYQ